MVIVKYMLFRIDTFDLERLFVYSISYSVSRYGKFWKAKKLVLSNIIAGEIDVTM